MSTPTTRIYQVSTQRKTIIFVTAAIAAMLGSFIAAWLFKGKSASLVVFIGVGIGVVLGSSQKIYTSTDRLTIKMLIGKSKEFLYSKGTFSLQEISGIKAFLMAFSSEALCLYYTNKTTGKKMLIGNLLSREDIESLYQEIKQHSSDNV